MDIRQIACASAEYEQEKQLRHAVMRAPLGMTLSDEDVAGEESQLHFAAFDGETLVGCVLFKLLDDAHAKLRQMAVANHMHGKGIGLSLVTYAEAALRQLGISHIVTDARIEARGFYARMGYKVEGEPYEVLGIPSILMVKAL